MVKLIQLYCSQCGAPLEVEADRKFCFCSYCGAKAIIDDGKSYTHIVDEAKIKEAEANERIKLRQAEVELQRIKAETATLEKIQLQQTQANLELEKQRIAAQQVKDEQASIRRIVVIGCAFMFLILLLVFIRVFTL